ncbi:MAG: alpha/beta fold hydrolase [Woeseiaceae bacterium]|nr:alpha/beta fold hydrolase [Woeseiaceae bacterium]
MNKSRVIVGVLLLFAAIVWAATPAQLEFEPLEALPAVDIIPGAEERRVRFGGAASTEWVILSVHGFSATRQETAPLAQHVADGLGANLLEIRLSGHGVTSEPLVGVRAEHWLGDVERALNDAAAMGNRIVAIGTSTGATLLAAALDQDIAERIDTLVMISPNFALADPTSEWMLAPGGRLLTWFAAGGEHCWEPDNELQGLYWTTCYPMAAIVEVMRVVERARQTIVTELQQSVLVFYSPDDEVVSPDAIVSTYEAMDVERKKIIAVHDAEDRGKHVLAGDILSPNRTEEIAAQILDFIQHPAR